MAENSRGSLGGRLREWRARRTQARAAARWPAPPEPAPESRTEDPLAARWRPETQPTESVATPPPALDPPSRWLTEEANAPGASTAVISAPVPSAAEWLPEGLERDEGPTVEGDSSRWVPDPDASVAQPASDVGTTQRRAAVEAYCGALCPPAAVAAAVDETLDSAGDSDADLLRATRSAAGARALPIAAPANWRQRLAAEHEVPCQLTPGRLAERANGTLDSHDQRELEHHLSGCADCRSVAERERQATEAFVATLPGAIAQMGADSPGASWLPSTAAAATGTTTTTPTEKPRRRHRLLPPLPVLAGIAALAVLIGAGAVVLTNSSSTHHAPAAPARAAATVTTPAAPQSKPPSKHHSTAAHHRTPARHRRAAHRATVHHSAHKASHKAPAAAVVTSTTPPDSVTPAPVLTTHPAAPAVHTTPPATSVSSVSQSSLPPESAPQQGVGKSGQ